MMFLTSQTKEHTSLLFVHGTHPDAVSRHITGVIGEINTSPNIDDYLSSPLFLTCLVAKVIS